MRRTELKHESSDSKKGSTDSKNGKYRNTEGPTQKKEKD